jgi:GNAT superfamily N-acetyltransferase
LGIKFDEVLYMLKIKGLRGLNRFLSGISSRLGNPLAFTFLIATSLLCLTSCTSSDWRSASRESAGIAADSDTNREAILQFYSADAWGWRGWFAVHTWIAAKPSDALSYTVYEVIGWRQSRGLPVVRIESDLPDRYWFGERPKLLKEFRGEGVDRLIIAVDQAARSYPWAETYAAFPGPNSNTFTAWIALQVPELALQLPFSAIGSGYAQNGLEP